MSDQDHPTGDTTRLISAEDLARLRARFTGQRASLIVLSGWQIGREYPLSNNETIVGRSPTADVVMALPSVSREHSRISRLRDKDGEYFEICDLRSMNGTHINNVLIDRARLRDGDKIQFGDVVMKFVVQDAIEAEYHQEVHRRIHFDQLTGLLTRESFKFHLTEEIRKAAPGARLTLAMTDLDGLKRVNDTYGHLMGGRIIQEMGSIMREVLRPTDFGGLYGGDEAMLLFPNTLIGDAEAIAEALRRRIADRRFEFEGSIFGVTISQGLAEWPRHGATMEQLMAAADGALYAAKGAGRNCIRVAEGDSATTRNVND
jgi:diguanylate cyclase (GGDEF)-like protein